MDVPVLTVRFDLVEFLLMTNGEKLKLKLEGFRSTLADNVTLFEKLLMVSMLISYVAEVPGEIT